MLAKPKSKTPSHLCAPVPQKFGLPHNFDANAYVEIITRKRKNHKIIAKINAFIISLTIACFLYFFSFGKNEIKESFSSSSTYIILLMFSYMFYLPIEYVFEKVRARFFHRIPSNIQEYFTAIVNLDKGLKDWNDRMLETGRAYWREMRSIAFERAVEQFLVRRGCSVERTKGSGDGGVDLRVTMGGRAFWCQCKGHASPIGVAVIREIAGVCSRGGGLPVLIAVNGYTNAAIDTAKNLDVILVDTHNLVTMAVLDKLNEWH